MTTHSRRKILKAAGIGGMALVADGLIRPASASAVPVLSGGAVDLTGAELAGAVDLADITASIATAAGLTTMARTAVMGPDVGRGYRKIIEGPGERHIVRSGLGGHRYALSYSLGAIAQLSDLQIVDDRSPARMEFLDKYAPGGYPTGSSYRPQETLSTHMTDALCRAIRKIGYGPRTGRKLDLSIVTGDAIDNVQYNETRWYIDLLDGGRTLTTASGDVDMSVTSGFNRFFPGADINNYWYPDPGFNVWSTYDEAGYPRIPGFLLAARRAYTTTGLGMPWYTAYGNHDGLWQGNLDIGTSLLHLNDRATGNSKLVDTDPLPADFEDIGLGQLGLLFGGIKFVASGNGTQDRRLLSREDYIKEHFKTVGTPAGHGFVQGSKVAYYTIPPGPDDLVTYIALDSTNLAGANFPFEFDGAAGSIDHRQLLWLEQQLRANSSRYLVADVPPPGIEFDYVDDTGHSKHVRLTGLGLNENAGSHVVNNPGVKDRLIVLYCHHTLASMTNTVAGKLLLSPEDGRWNGTALRRLLLAYPNVIAIVNGHTHANRIDAHRRPDGHGFDGGFWEISTAAHVDWPVQSRIIEIASGAGVVSLFTTVVDPDAPLDYNGNLATQAHLASLGRELAANDIQEKDDRFPPIHFPDPPSDGSGTRRGRLEDRNTQLLVPAPFPLPDPFPDSAGVAIGLSETGSGTRLDLYGTGPGGQVQRGSLLPVRDGGTFSWNGDLGLNTMRSIAVCTNSDGRVEIFGVTPQTFVYHRVQSSPGNWAGSTWQQFDGQLNTITAANSGGKLEIYGTNGLGRVFYRRQVTAGTWAGSFWEEFVGQEMNQLAATKRKDSKIVLFGATKLGTLWMRTQTTPGSWAGSSWQSLPGFARSLAALTTFDLDVRLFATDEDGRVHVMHQELVGNTVQTNWAPIDNDPAWARFNIRQIAVSPLPVGQGAMLIGVDPSGAAYVRQTGFLMPHIWTDWKPLITGLRQTTLPQSTPVVTKPPTQATPVGGTVDFSMPSPVGGEGPYGWYFSGLPAGLTGSRAGRVTGVNAMPAGPGTTVTALLVDNRHLTWTVTFQWKTIGGTMPDVVGMLDSDALFAIEQLGIGASTKLVPTSSKAHWDHVVAQLPAPGTAVDMFTKATITVACEPGENK